MQNDISNDILSNFWIIVILFQIDRQIAEINVQHYEWLWPETISKLFSHDRIKDIVSIIKNLQLFAMHVIKN